MYSAPATPQYAYAPPMPAFEKGGRVKDTYGLDNVAEMIRQRGREGDTVLAHISPQEAGILQLLGGSGTINPYTGLPEFKNPFKKIIPKPIYKLGSKIGQAIEGGIESIARNKILGPIAQMASYLHPVSAFLYAGLSPEGSSFDVKGAAKAAVMQQIAQGVKQYAMGTPADGGIGIGSDGASMSDLPYSGSGGPGGFGPGGFDAGGFEGVPGMDPNIPSAPPVGAVESAVTSAGPQAINYPGSGIGEPVGQFASAGTTATDAGLGSLPEVTPERLPTYSEQYFDNMMGQPASYADVGEVPTFDYGRVASDISEASADPNAFQKGVNALKQGYSDVKQGISNIIPEPVKDAYDVVKDYLPDRQDVRDVVGITSLGTTVYSAYQTKKELDAAKADAERVLADRANKTKEEIEFAQSVLRDYPYNYQRLTEEEVRRERGMAMGGRINSYDDEIGSDDGMMQGGIAALAKGGLPPRYLRGGGDGMSDSIKANIEGKQEARLADGEFVIPADVVSHLGNGSSNAGAKKLYAMMNRIRKSRTGKTRQAPEVNTRRLMPA
jgi:hypothetical protein